MLFGYTTHVVRPKPTPIATPARRHWHFSAGTHAKILFGLGESTHSDGPGQYITHGSNAGSLCSQVMSFSQTPMNTRRSRTASSWRLRARCACAMQQARLLAWSTAGGHTVMWRPDSKHGKRLQMTAEPVASKPIRPRGGLGTDTVGWQTSYAILSFLLGKAPVQSSICSPPPLALLLMKAFHCGGPRSCCKSDAAPLQCRCVLLTSCVCMRRSG